jgi:predicted adenine nucleotide alpha hydrolase (AANH) superfamily ATPase
MSDKFLLLSCCAPCSCAVIKKLAKEGADFAVVFYNPNIAPLEEYRHRCEDNKKVCELYEVPFVELEYDNERWCELIAGLENEPERGKRCEVCFEMRLKRVMEYARENGFDAVASVLGVSRYKNLDQVNCAGERASVEVGVSYIHVEGRKDGMQEMRLALIEELQLYEQNYCGCPSSTGRGK